MKFINYILFVLTALLSGCMLPQGANGCDHLNSKYEVCFLFDESGEAIITDGDSSLEVVSSKTYALSPSKDKLVVSEWRPYKFFSQAENREYRNTRLFFSNEKGNTLSSIEAGQWQVFLTYKLSDGVEREAVFAFEVTKSLYVPFIMRPN
jgi:hypothetical protein